MEIKNLFHPSKNYYKKIVVGVFTFFFTTSLYANPVIDNIAAGNISIQQNQNTTTVNQTSQQAIINWQSFNIGQSETTHFQQPTGGIILNRINPTQGASQIYGRLTATGQIILVNPAGINFGASAYVNVGGMIATTSNITDQDFLNHYYHFTPVDSYSGSIINKGQIIAAEHGLIALVGGNVRNDGLIQANFGQVILASGGAATISFADNGLVSFTIDPSSSNQQITNTGAIVANGGSIYIAAKSVSAMLDHSINLEGVMEAQSVSQKKGVIILAAEDGNVRVAAKINASGKKSGEQGGNVTITGKNILIDSTTDIDVSGDSGGGTLLIGGNYQGKGPELNATNTTINHGAILNASAINQGNGGKVVVWADNATDYQGSILSNGGLNHGNGGDAEVSGKNYLNFAGTVNLLAPKGLSGNLLLDPVSITIQTAGVTTGGFTNPYTSNTTGSILTVANLQNALLGASVTVNANAGDIAIANDVTWANANTLTLNASNNITFAAGVVVSNTGAGTLNLRTDSAATGVSNGVGTQYTVTFGAGSGVDFSNGGQVNIFYNPASYAAPTNFSGNVTLGGGALLSSYMLVNTAANLQAINTDSTTLSGSYALGTNIDASSIPSFTPISTFTGNFNGQNYTISNLTINDVANTSVGLFGAYNNAAGFIQNFTLTGNISASASSADVGGIVGTLLAGTISNVRNQANILLTSTATSLSVGGIVGEISSGSVLNSSNTGNITLSGAGGSNNLVGGLVGSGVVTINGGFNTGTISSINASTDVLGGIVGSTQGSSSIQNVYNAGNVSCSGTNCLVGGLLGSSTSGTTALTTSYNLGIVSATGTGASFGGLVGNTTNINTSNSYWNTTTSGTTNGAGNSASLNALGFNTAAMQTQSTYSGFDFVGTWGISAGYYPYLKAFYSSTPQLVSGTYSGGTVNVANSLASTLKIAVNGTIIANPSLYADGSYYYTLPTSTIANNGIILAYLANGSTYTGNTIDISNGGNAVVNITSATVTAQSDNASAVTNANLSTAKGSIVDAGILYSLDGSTNLTINGTNNFQTLSGTNYNLAGKNITNTNGNITLAGLLTLATADSILTATNITLNGGVTGGTRGLTLVGSSGVNIGATALTGLSSLTTTGTGAINLDSSNITTTANQTYNRAVTLIGTGATLSANTSTFSSTVNGTTAGTQALGITGKAVFSGSIGNTRSLSTIAVSGTTGINNTSSTSFITTGTQTYTGALTLNNLSSFSMTSSGASGGITFGSSIASIANMSINSPTNGVTFNGNVGSIGSGPGTFSVTGTSTFANNISVSGVSNLGLGAIVLGTSGTVTFNTNNGSHNISGNITSSGAGLTFSSASGILNFNGAAVSIGSSGARLSSLTINRPFTALGGSLSVYTTGNQNYGSTLTIGPTTILDSSTGNISLAGIAGPGRALTINTPLGTTQFSGNIGAGGVSRLTSIAVTGTTNFAAAVNTFTTGSQSYGASTIGGNLSILASDVTFNSTVNGASAGTQTLGITGNGIFNGSIGGTLSLASLSVSGTTNFAPTGTMNVNTTGTQLYTGAVTLGGSATPVINLSSSGVSGGVTFSNLIDGASSLSISSPTNGVTFNNLIGNTTPLASLTVSSGATTFNGSALGAKTTGNQSYGAVTLSTGINTFLSTGASGTISFGTITGGGNSLSLNASGLGGAINFNNTVNNILNLTTINGNLNLVSPTSITTTGTQTFGGNLTLTAGDTTLTGTTISLNGGVTGVSHVLILSGATGVAIGATALTGLSSLNTTGAGAITLNGSSITSTGAQTYNNAVTLATGAVNLTSSAGNLSFNNTINGAQALTVSSATGTTFNSNVGSGTALSSLTNSAGAITLGASTSSITTSGLQSYTGNLNLGTDTTLTSSSNNLTINGGVTGASHALILSGSTGVAIGATALTGLSSLNTTGAGAITLNGSSITSTGAQTYNRAVTLATSAVSLTSTAANLSFSNTINGAQALTVSSATGTTFNGNIGSGTALSSLTNSTGIVTLGAATSSITTSGLQSYVGNLNLGADTTLTSNSSNLSLNGVTGGSHALTLNGATGVAINATALNGLTTLSVTGATTLNNSSITTSGSQTYNSAITLATGAVNLTSSAASLNFNNTIDGAEAFTISSATGTTFNGNIGNISALSSLTETAGTVTLGAAASSIITSGLQSYANNLTLGTDTTLTSNSSNLTLNGVTGSSNALTLSGATGVVIGATALNGLTTFNVTGSTTLNNSSITTSGTQIYTNNITLENAVQLTSLLSDITFNGNIVDPTTTASLAINTENGVTTLNGDIGTSLSPLQSLTITTNNLSLMNDTNLASLDLALQFTNLQGNGKTLSLTSQNTLAITGTFNNLNNLNLVGINGATTLSLESNANQTWNISGFNQGAIILSGVNAATFSNIQNLVGSSNDDNFILSSGNVDSIEGGDGYNTISVNTPFNTEFVFSDAYAGQITNGGTFNDIQNFVGDTSTANGSMILNFSNMTDIHITLLSSNIHNGSVANSIDFSNALHLIGNPATVRNNLIFLPTNKTNVVVFTNAQKTSGYINDPLFFTNFTLPTYIEPTPVATYSYTYYLIPGILEHNETPVAELDSAFDLQSFIDTIKQANRKIDKNSFYRLLIEKIYPNDLMIKLSLRK